MKLNEETLEILLTICEEELKRLEEGAMENFIGYPKHMKTRFDFVMNFMDIFTHSKTVTISSDERVDVFEEKGYQYAMERRQRIKEMKNE